MWWPNVVMQLINNRGVDRSSQYALHQYSQRPLLTLVAIVCSLAFSTSVLAQRGGDKKEKPKPRIVKLKTKDGFELKALYVPTDKGKEAVTVMVVHEFGGQASPYIEMVQTLNKAGFAVLVPVYRGHGDSTSYTDASGREHKVDQSRMNKADIQKIVTIDLEKSKQFLKDENNEGNLNLNALVLVGIGDGCVLAANWAQVDWSFPSVGSVKQSQDVKALVLVTPDRLLKGISIDGALKDRNIMNLPLMIVGSGGSQAKDTRRIAKTMENLKSRMGGGEAKGFKVINRSTALTGPALITQDKKLAIEIAAFIKDSVPITGEDNPWIDRTR